MRYIISTLKRKLIVGALALLILGVLLPFGRVLADTAGNAYQEDIIFSYESDGSFYETFKAKITYDVEWVESGANCIPKAISYNYFFPYIASDNWAGLSFPLENLGLFSDGQCHTETFSAGGNYKVYLTVEENIPRGSSESYVRENNIRKVDEEDDKEIKLYMKYDSTIYYDFGHYLTLPPEITINYPSSEAEIGVAFTMEIDYARASDYERLMIIFEDWDSSSTCPLYDSAEFEEEHSKWFNYQSLPYFSDFFTTSTGTTTIDVYDLNTGNYNCSRCVFINETEGTMSGELCRNYTINILSYIPPKNIPSYYLPVSKWEDYYTEHSERFPTSTPLFTVWAGTIEPLISWIGNMALSFQDYFNPDEARAKGMEMGNAIPIARGYLENIDDFFGGLPISTVLIFYLLTALVIIIYRLVKGILTIIIP